MPTNSPAPAPAEIETALARLSAAPRRLAAASRAVPEARLAWRPAPEAWSAAEILAHLRACSDVWGKSIEAMLQRDHPTLRYVSPRTRIRKTNYPELAFLVSLPAFTQQRQALLQTLQALSPADWSRGATFTGTTRGRYGTVLGYAQRLTQHEAEHLAEVEALLK